MINFWGKIKIKCRSGNEKLLIDLHGPNHGEGSTSRIFMEVGKEKVYIYYADCGLLLFVVACARKEPREKTQTVKNIGPYLRIYHE